MSKFLNSLVATSMLLSVPFISFASKTDANANTVNTEAKSTVKSAFETFTSTVADFMPSMKAFMGMNVKYDAKALFSEMNLEGLIDYSVFERGIAGLNEIDPSKNEVITIADFTKPSNKERFFVFDLKNKKILFKTHVAHGRNSGQQYATSFSNTYGSYKSSPGFYKTVNTYQGRNGYSLRLDGLEKGINDNAMQRAIVVHGSKYVNDAIARAKGQVGRSLGCPALPNNVSKSVINAIKGGSLLYIHSDNKDYVAKSKIVKDINDLSSSVAPGNMA